MPYSTTDLVPRPRSNFFDSPESANIIARYANTSAGLASAADLAKAASGLEEGRMRRSDDEFRQKQRGQQSTEWDRENENYKAQQDYRTRRGEFLAGLSQLDPMADDYDAKRSELYANLPIEAQKDDAVRDIVAAKDRIFQQGIAAREHEALRQQVLQERNATQLQNAAIKFGSMGLRPEEYARDPDTGELDFAETAVRAAARKAELDKAAMDARGADRDLERERKADEEAAKLTLGDQTAFPTQTSSFIARGLAKPPVDKPALTDLQKADPAGYEAARGYDKDQYASEVNSARNMKKDEYVGKVSGLSEAQKKKRESLWDHANGRAPSTTPAQPKVIPTDSLVPGKRYRGADGSIRTYKGNGQWE